MDLDGIYRTEYGRCVATLTRLLGDIGLAEEAVQDAFAVALQKWDQTPPNPGAWIVTTARNRAIDRLRRESTRQTRHTQALLLRRPDGSGLDARRADAWWAGRNGPLGRRCGHRSGADTRLGGRRRNATCQDAPRACLTDGVRRARCPGGASEGGGGSQPGVGRRPTTTQRGAVQPDGVLPDML